MRLIITFLLTLSLVFNAHTNIYASCNGSNFGDCSIDGAEYDGGRYQDELIQQKKDQNQQIVLYSLFYFFSFLVLITLIYCLLKFKKHKHKNIDSNSNIRTVLEKTKK